MPRAECGEHMDFIAGIFAPDPDRTLVVSIAAGGKRGSEESWLQADSNSTPASASVPRQNDKRGVAAPSLKLFTATRLT